jgi:PAS domain S-box-containing protein
MRMEEITMEEITMEEIPMQEIPAQEIPAQEAAVPLEQVFRLLAEATRAAVLLFRADTLIYANNAAVALTGWRQDELKGKRREDLVHPDFRRRMNGLSQSRVRGESALTRHQFKMLTREGSERWVDLAEESIELDGASFSLWTCDDITDQRRDSAVLMDAEQRYTEIFENSVEGIYQCDAAGNLTSANRSLARILGYGLPREMGEALTSVPDHLFVDPRRHAELVRSLCSEGHVRGFDAELRRHDGSTAWVSISANAFFDESLRLQSYNAFLQDVTEQRLLERRFLQAQKMEAIGRLAGGIAHDFNNILTVLMGYCESLLDLLPPEHPGESSAREIKNAAQRAAMLTRQLLAFSRQQVTQPVVLDVNHIIRSMEGMVRRLIGEDIELSMDLVQGPAWVRADPHQVEQVVMNLVVNARDALPRGGTIRITTAARAEPAPGAVELGISDTGVGMSEEIRSRIFEPFFTTKPPGQGTGLGLSTVYGIVEQSGGSIAVESVPGLGSRFTVSFPRAQGGPSALPVESGALAGGAESLLVVEDDPIVRAVTARMLREAGYHVREAVNGQNGLAILEESAYGVDLVVSDLVMPRMGGRQLAESIWGRFPEIRVLFISGYPALEPGDEVSGLARSHLLSKPFTRGDLLSKVRDILDARQGPAKAEEPAASQ